MEHRLHRRESADLLLKLVSGGEVVANVRTTDLSQCGIGIETPDYPLTIGNCVRVDLCKPGHPRGINCCLHAMVIHSNARITGLMFTEESSGFIISDAHKESLHYQI
jgi:hypothetical protein